MRRLISIFLVFLLSACSDDGYFGPIYLDETSTLNNISAARLIVVCEGNFQFSNASISVIDLIGNRVDDNAFQKANGFGIGDVAQSIYQRNDSLFVVVNNSGLIRILSSDSLKEIGTIEHLQSPRHLLLKGRKMFVTDLYANKISEIDLASLEILKTFPVDGWTERIISFGDFIVAANIEQRSLYVYNHAMQLIQMKQLSLEPHFLFEFENDLYIVGARSQSNRNTSLQRLNAQFDLVDSTSITNPINYACQDKGQLYMVSNHSVFKYKFRTLMEVFSQKIDLENPYSIAINRTNKHIFITDVKDYLSKGEVVEFDSTASRELETYKVGYIPQSMYFTL